MVPLFVFVYFHERSCVYLADVFVDINHWWFAASTLATGILKSQLKLQIGTDSKNKTHAMANKLTNARWHTIGDGRGGNRYEP